MNSDETSSSTVVFDNELGGILVCHRELDEYRDWRAENFKRLAKLLERYGLLRQAKLLDYLLLNMQCPFSKKEKNP